MKVWGASVFFTLCSNAVQAHALQEINGAHKPVKLRRLGNVAATLRGGGTTYKTSAVSGKVTGYDPGRLHRWGWLALYGPSVLSSSFLWLQCCGVLGLAGLSCFITLATKSSNDMALVSLSEGLEDALHALIIFLLGLFINEVISRW